MWFTIIVSNHVIAQSNQQQQQCTREMKICSNHLYICGYLKCTMYGPYNTEECSLSIVPPAFEEYVIFFYLVAREKNIKFLSGIGFFFIQFSNMKTQRGRERVKRRRRISFPKIWFECFPCVHMRVCMCACVTVIQAQLTKRDQKAEESNGHR